MAIDLTQEATQGYVADSQAVCPYLATSSSSAAWHVGRWLRDTGRSAPRGVRPGRGSRIHANDMLLDVSDEKSIQRLQ
jgi:hypothetical protein